MTTEEGLAVASNFWMTHQTEVTLSAFSVAVVLGMVLGVREIMRAKDLEYVKQYVPRMRHKALHKERERSIDAQIAHKIVYGVQQLVWSGAITQFDANKRYRLLGSLLDNQNFIPTPMKLKAEIKARREAARLHPPKDKIISHDNKVVAFGSRSIRRISKKA